jgi:hypothetical protein
LGHFVDFEMRETLSIRQLAERCQEETARYQRTQQSDPTYCFDLFHQALAQQVEAAWSAIVTQYEDLVTHWAYGFGAGDLAEVPAVFVNEAFSRMWQYGRKAETIARLDNLGKCLSYLKKCVWSAVEEGRQHRQQAVLVTDWRKLGADHPTLPGPEIPVGLENLRQVVWETLAELVQNETEHRVAELTWVYDLKPRQIQAAYPTQFASAAEVSQIKKNILKRLQRNEILMERLRALLEG